MGRVSKDELEQNFLSELCNMRLQIAYQRVLKERTAEEADKEQKRDMVGS